MGTEAGAGPGVLCWGMNWKMRLGGKSDRVPLPGFNPLCPWASCLAPTVADFMVAGDTIAGRGGSGVPPALR